MTPQFYILPDNSITHGAAPEGAAVIDPASPRPFAYRIVTAACEKEPPTAARFAAYYGKVVVCLHEAFSGQGYQLQRSAEAVLRNAKLKAQ